MGAVTVRLYAAAAEAAGTHQLSVELSSSPMALQQLLTELNETASVGRAPVADAGRVPSLERVCAQSSFLINGTRAPVSRGQVTIGDVVDVLPPFAGG
ncbi:MoaD/ThiS family protein [Nesterenkonia natronophila]|uniref:MoaD/ThiS family protein n=1 Tax=Nesterenkonia natronophila TaxID=2174932 RepID=A0A3A4F4W5_9MICC|nr:MoaD/ThiS family protein [Nesterenkonia natronophila]RJN32846.1 MoaD/ThiS family protein [Nesterenkonia natronophila]